MKKLTDEEFDSIKATVATMRESQKDIKLNDLSQNDVDELIKTLLMMCDLAVEQAEYARSL